MMKKLCYLFAVCGVVMMFSCQKDKNQPGIIEEEIKLDPPTVSSISPTEGNPLSIFTITGNNFSLKKDQNEVTINGVSARIISVTATTIQAEVPLEGSTGPVKVKVLSNSVTGPVFTVNEIKVIVYITDTYAGIVPSPTSGYVEGNRLAAKFNAPEGVAFDSKGNMIIADRSNHVIRKISTDGTVSLLAGTPNVSGAVDGPGASASFFNPLKVALDAQDNIYVADRDNHKIRKIDAVTNIVTTVAGSGNKAFADGVGVLASFNSPLDVAITKAGVIYVADSGNDRIRKIAKDGTVTTLAGTNSRAFADGTGEEAKFADPSGIALDKDENILVADRRNHKLRKVTPTGVVTTVVGTTAGFVDGTLLESKLSSPFGVTVGKDGAIYIVEIGNHAVRMINSDNIMSTIGGNSDRVAGWEDGNPSRFSTPTDIAVDAKGVVYVAEIGNHLIRRITPTEK